jgi:hypothetical protein
MRTKGNVNTIDGPGKNFRSAFSFTPFRGSGITSTAFLEFILTISHLQPIIKYKQKSQGQGYVPGSGRPGGATAAVRASRLAFMAVSLGHMVVILPNL